MTEEEVTQVRQDVVIAVEWFEEKVNETTLFFAWREGEEILPEQAYGKEKKSLNRLFLETQILFFVVFIALFSKFFNSFVHSSTPKCFSIS